MSGGRVALGEWDAKKAIQMMTNDSIFPYWESKTIPISIEPSDVQDNKASLVIRYKYIVFDKHGNLSSWEEGEDRSVDLSSVSSNQILIEDDGWGENRLPAKILVPRVENLKIRRDLTTIDEDSKESDLLGVAEERMPVL